MYDAAWISEQQEAIYVTFEGKWQPDEFFDLNHDVHQMLDQVSHAASIVIHITQPRPISMEMITQIRNFLSLEHPNRNQFLIIAPETYLAGVTEIIRRSFGGEVPPYIYFSARLQDMQDWLRA